MCQDSLRNKHFRGVGEQRKTEERDFRCFSCAENGASAKKRKMGEGKAGSFLLPAFPFPSRLFNSLHFSRCNFLLLNPTETLSTQVSAKTERASFITARQRIGSNLCYFFKVFLCWLAGFLVSDTLECRVESYDIFSPKIY